MLKHGSIHNGHHNEHESSINARARSARAFMARGLVVVAVMDATMFWYIYH